MPLRSLLVLGVAGLFILIGILFVAAPGPAALVFGIPAETGSHPYLRALGLRDLALALYLIGLVLASSEAALMIVLGASVLIPVGDIALVLAYAGTSALGSLLLHAASAVVLAALTVSFRAAEKRRTLGD